MPLFSPELFPQPICQERQENPSKDLQMVSKNLRNGVKLNGLVVDLTEYFLFLMTPTHDTFHFSYGYKTLLEGIKEDILLLESLDKKTSSLALSPSTKKTAAVARCNSLDTPQTGSNKNEAEHTSPQQSSKTKDLKNCGDKPIEESSADNSDRMCTLS